MKAPTNPYELAVELLRQGHRSRGQPVPAEEALTAEVRELVRDADNQRAQAGSATAALRALVDQRIAYGGTVNDPRD